MQVARLRQSQRLTIFGTPAGFLPLGRFPVCVPPGLFPDGSAHPPLCRTQYFSKNSGPARSPRSAQALSFAALFPMPQRAEDFSLSPGQAVVIVVIVVVIVIVAANEFFEQFHLLLHDAGHLLPIQAGGEEKHTEHLGGGKGKNIAKRSRTFLIQQILAQKPSVPQRRGT